MTNQAWDELHERYAQSDWIDKPNIFAEQVLSYLPEHGTLLDIGAGQGQDSRFFALHGFKVTGIDVSGKALEEAEAKLTEENKAKIELIKADISKGLQFDNGCFDVVYAHLSLHYFDAKTTDAILKEVARVLKSGGIFAFFVNSTTDPEYGQGELIEQDYYFIEGKPKRYFSVESARAFANKYFEEILADNKGETYKDAQKGIHNLIRYIGKKRAEY